MTLRICFQRTVLLVAFGNASYFKTVEVSWGGGDLVQKGKGCVRGFGSGNMGERDHCGDPGVDRRIILRWIFRNLDEGYGLDSGGSGERQLAGTWESFGFHKMREIS
jgi:hypothetical protein